MNKLTPLLFLVAVSGVSFGQDISSGLIAEYTFEGSPNDVSGNGNNATPAGLFQYLTNGLAGSAIRIQGDSALFYSGGGYVQLPAFTANLNSGFTVSLWVKDEVLGGDPVNEECYISFGILDQPMGAISYNTSTQQIEYALSYPTGTPLHQITAPFPGASAWKQLVLTYTPGKMAAYLNGTKVGEQLATVNLFPATKAALGRHWWSGGAGSAARMSVTFDNVRMYSRALTDTDVQQLYITELTPPSPTPSITTQPVGQTVIEQQRATFQVIAASATPVLYQWAKNGVPIPGALAQSYTISSVKPSDAGTYSVAVTNAAGSTVSGWAILTVVPENPGRLINMSVLGSGGFTTGFVIGGGTPKNVLLRAVGPTLKNFGVPNPSPSATLTLYSGATIIASNSGWSSAQNATQIASIPGPFPLPSGSADAAILVSLNPGSYTAQAAANGAVLLEIYEAP